MYRDFGWDYAWSWYRRWGRRDQQKFWDYWRDASYHNLAIGPFYCWWLQRGKE